MHTKERLHYLFQQYLDNTCTKEELKELLALSEEADFEQHLTEELKAHWKNLDRQKLEDEVNWEGKYRNLIELARTSAPFDQSIRSKVVGMQVWKVAAVLMLVLGAAFIVWKSGSSPRGENIAAAGVPAKPKDSAAHRQLINLPDGSTVVLNENSKLEYPPDFSNGKREVYLNGEAFFDIAHDPSKPFIVHTGSISTKVLGTAFNINAYRSQQFVEVTVTRGKVEVKAKEKVLGVLQKNEQIVFHRATEKYSKKTVSTEPVIAWRKSELYFDDASFAEAALVLSNRYHVTIQFANEKVRTCQFTAAFDNSTSLEHALAVICELNNATYKREENKILIAGEGCD